MKTETPKVKRERVIAESRDMGGWLVMWPDGKVVWYKNQKSVMAAVGNRLGKSDAMITEIEWRT